MSDPVNSSSGTGLRRKKSSASIAQSTGSASEKNAASAGKSAKAKTTTKGRKGTDESTTESRGRSSSNKSASKSPKGGAGGRRKKSTSKSPRRKSSSQSKGSLNEAGKAGGADERPKSTDEFEDMSSQSLVNIPLRIIQKTTLKTLILSNNNIRGLPGQIADLVNLEHLDISRNPLRVKDQEDVACIPLQLRTLRKLKRLNMSESNIRYLPFTLWLCSTLEYLDVSRNKLGYLSADVGNLQELVTIDLTLCNLTTLPNEIGFCARLKEIILVSNQIESLPDTLKDCRSLESIHMSLKSFSALIDPYMEGLILNGQIKSEHIPIVLFELENLRALDLKSTKINNLPENNLRSIQTLHLDNNYIEKIAPGIMTNMSATLRELTISHNMLKEIPVEINSLVSLEVLDLCSNQIECLFFETKADVKYRELYAEMHPTSEPKQSQSQTSVPTPVQAAAASASVSYKINLRSLKELYLSHNKLVYLNENIKYLSGLTRLTLGANKLIDLNEGLFQLYKLNYLDLSDNELTRLSTKFVRLRALKQMHAYDKFLDQCGLWLLGNRLEVPPKHIWQTKNIKKLYNYLSDYDQMNLNYVFYSKLMFVGNSGVGKSYLVDSLLNTRYLDELARGAGGGGGDEPDSYKTRVARKFYKRTKNKVEWFILDMAGDPAYRPLLSLFCSSIGVETVEEDTYRESTLLLVVYDHNKYKTSEHDKHIGAWLSSLLSGFRSLENVRFKLVGVLNENEQSEFEQDDLAAAAGADRQHARLPNQHVEFRLSSQDEPREPSSSDLAGRRSSVQSGDAGELGNGGECDEDEDEINLKLTNKRKVKLVLHNCNETIEAYYRALAEERERVVRALEEAKAAAPIPQPQHKLARSRSIRHTGAGGGGAPASLADVQPVDRDEHRLEQLDALLARRRHEPLKMDDIFLISKATRKEEVAALVKFLEQATVRFHRNRRLGDEENERLQVNKAPLDLRNRLRSHLMKLGRVKMSLVEFRQSLLLNSDLCAYLKQQSPELRLNLTVDKAISYAKTIGEIFFMDRKLGVAEYGRQLNDEAELLAFAAANGDLIRARSFDDEPTGTGVVTGGAKDAAGGGVELGRHVDVYLRYSHLLTLLQVLVRHDLDRLLGSSVAGRSIFELTGLYMNKRELSTALALASKYGLFEYKLIKAVYFCLNQMNEEEIGEAIALLADFFVVYVSETQHLTEKNSFKYVAIPIFNRTHFAHERDASANSKRPQKPRDPELFDEEHYERFFNKLDRIRKCRAEIKRENALTKQRELWNTETLNNNDYEYYDQMYGHEDDASEASDDNKLDIGAFTQLSSLINLNAISDAQLLSNSSQAASQAAAAGISNAESFYQYFGVMLDLADDASASKMPLVSLDDLKYLSKKLEALKMETPVYRHRCVITVSVLGEPRLCHEQLQLFARLACIVQGLSYERFDWCDCIIGRNVDNSCFRVRRAETGGLSVDFKSLNARALVKLKLQFERAIQLLFGYTPGLYYSTTIRISTLPEDQTGGGGVVH